MNYFNVTDPDKTNINTMYARVFSSVKLFLLTSYKMTQASENPFLDIYLCTYYLVSWLRFEWNTWKPLHLNLPFSF